RRISYRARRCGPSAPAWSKPRPPAYRHRASGCGVLLLKKQVALPSFIISWFLQLLDNGENIGLFEDQDFLAIQLDLRARILRVKLLVVLLHIHRNQLAILIPAANAHGDDRALLWLFLCRFGQQNATSGNFFALIRLDNDAIPKWF